MIVDAPIGVIDSGVGGLTVVKEMLHRLPEEQIIYIGDEANCPYGPRPAEEVKQFTMAMATALSKMGIKMLVIACNTATAVALEEVRAHFSFPIIGVIEPGARAAVQASSTKQIAVLGTIGTIQSGAYVNAIQNLESQSTIHSLACPQFVPIVESGNYRTEEAYSIVKTTLQPLMNKSFDAVILGCTHYPLLQAPIAAHLSSTVEIISSAVETVRDVEKILQQYNIANSDRSSKEPIFYSTGQTNHFKMIVQDWLAITEPNVQTICLTK